MIAFEWIPVTAQSFNKPAQSFNLVLKWQNFLSLAASQLIAKLTITCPTYISHTNFTAQKIELTFNQSNHDPYNDPRPTALWSVRESPHRMRMQLAQEARLYYLDNFGFPRDIGPHIRSAIFDEIEFMIASMIITH